MDPAINKIESHNLFTQMQMAEAKQNEWFEISDLFNIILLIE